MRALFAAVAGLVLLTSGGLTQSPTPSAAALQKLGPQIGERVPDFSLVDQGGTTRTLKSILGPNGAMLVFFRSAEW